MVTQSNPGWMISNKIKKLSNTMQNTSNNVDIGRPQGPSSPSGPIPGTLEQNVQNMNISTTTDKHETRSAHGNIMDASINDLNSSSYTGTGWQPGSLKSNENVQIDDYNIHSTKVQERKIWISKGSKAENNQYGFDIPGGNKTKINLDKNPRLNDMLNLMEMQKKNLTNRDTSSYGFDTRTGLDLKPKPRPGEQPFTITDHSTNDTRIAYYNIGKNVDPKQFQATLNNQSFNAFENNVQNKFATSIGGGGFDQGKFNDIKSDINKSKLTAKEKKKLLKDLNKKGVNYQKAVGGYDTSAPWQMGNMLGEPSKAQLLQSKLDSGGKLTAKEDRQLNILTGRVGQSGGASNLGGYEQFLP
jgi:hypothetical protein